MIKILLNKIKVNIIIKFFKIIINKKLLYIK